MKDKMYVYEEDGCLNIIVYEPVLNTIKNEFTGSTVYDNIFDLVNNTDVKSISNSYGFPVITFNHCDLIFDKTVIKNPKYKELLFVIYNIIGPKKEESFKKVDEKNTTILDVFKSMVSNKNISNKFYNNIKIPITATIAAATLVNFGNVKETNDNAKSEDFTTETTISDYIISDISTNNEEELEVLNDSIYIEEEEFINEITSNNIVLKDSIDSNNKNKAFDIGSGVTPEIDEQLKNYINTSEGKLIFQYSHEYGVDPYLMIALAMNESTLDHDNTLPGESRFNNHAVGLFQHENPEGEKIVAYNYETHEYEADYITLDNAINVETNIKLAVMKMQSCIINNNYNVLLALQAYNGGQGFVNIVSSKFRSELNIDARSVSSTVSILEYTKEFEKLATNTNEYINSLPKDVETRNPNTYNEMKGKETFGTGDYIAKVMSYYIGSRGVFKSLNENGEEIVRIYSYQDENYIDYILENEELDVSKGR